MAADPIPLRTEDLLAHAGWLRALARSLVADPATADDLVQDTWVAALRHPPDGDRPLRPWLARVVHNLASNRRRGDVRRGDREAVERPASEGISPDKIAAEIEAQRMLAEAVLALDEPLRTTVVLRYFRGLNASEIAAAQNVPSGTVRWRLKRAIELLRVDLDGRFGGHRESWCVALAALVPRQTMTTAATKAAATSAATKVSIMSTSTKIGIATALVLCVGIAVWKLAGSTPSPSLSRDERGSAWNASENVRGAPSNPTPIDSVAADVGRESAIADPMETHDEAAGAPAVTLTPLTADECCIVGRVVDHRGAPLANAVVVATPTDVEEPGLLSRQSAATEAARTTSGESGEFRLRVASATPCAVIAELEGFAPRALSPSFAGQVVEVVLTRGTTLDVRVVSWHSGPPGTGGSPIENASVEATATADGQARSFWWGTSTTASGGNATLHGVPAGEIRVRTDAKGFPPEEIRVLSTGDGTTSCEIMLSIPCTIEGTVIDRTTRVPIADAGVDARGFVGVATDSNGKYELSAFTAGFYTHSVRVSADGYAPSYTYVSFLEGGTRSRHDFELVRGQHVRGRVTDAAGGPVLGASVSYSAHVATEPFVGETHRDYVETTDDGVFEIDDIYPDTQYRVVITAQGHGARSLSIGPFAGGSVAIDIGDLALTSPGSIRGRVEAPSLQEGWYVVRLHAEGGEQTEDRSRLASTRPDPRGRFAFENLGAGRYRLELWRRGSRSADADDSAIAWQSIELRTGEVLDSLVLRNAANELRGRIVDTDGSPLGGCYVGVFDERHSTEGVALATTGDDGRFAIALPTDGVLDLGVEDPRLFHDSRWLEAVRPGGEELVIVLEPFRSEFAIRGRLVDPSGKPPERVYVAFTDRIRKQRLGRVAMPDESGRFEMLNLRDVAYDLELVDFGNLYKPAKVANVKPSGDDVVLQIERRE